MLSELVAQPHCYLRQLNMFKLNSNQGVVGSTPLVPATFFVETDHEIVFTVILSLALIKEGQLLAKECARLLVYCVDD